MSNNQRVTTYEDLGVRPLINCTGTITTLSGSLLLPEVREAMMAASTRYVIIDELMAGVGARLAELMQCEWGLVTNGCAAALAQVTAACIAGTDPEKMQRLPDTTGMKNEVIVQTAHRMGYDRAITSVGARLIEVTTHEELEAAYTDRTAMQFLFGDASERGPITVKDMVDSGHAHGVPSLVDAAAEQPNVPNWYLAQGVDVVAYSGGKCMRGPQASGMVLGRKDLLQAAFANGSPHGSIGRPMKAGKEEIMGLLAAVEQWLVRDHAAELREWDRRLQVIADAVTAIPSVTLSFRTPRPSNIAPHMSLQWNAAELGVSPTEAKQQLSAGAPRIEIAGGGDNLTINPYMMEDGEEVVVARRLAEVLGAGSVHTS